MNALLRSWAAPSAWLIALPLVLGACGDDKKTVPADADAGVETGPQKPQLGGKLGAAVRAAESAQASQPKSGDGPPEAGIFAPGAADKVLAPGAPAKVELLGEGADPKVLLAYAPGDAEQIETVSIMVRTQGGALPLDCTLALKVDKPKADKAKDDKAPPAAAGSRVLAKIVGIPANPQMPKELGEQLAKLKGTELRYQLSPQGVISDASYTLAKGADAGLDTLIRPLVEAIGLLTPPLPTKPVGVGAYWMATDRLTSVVVDVVRYRVFRVEKLDKDHATMGVDVRQYVAKSEVDAGGGQKLVAVQFDSQGKGKVDWAAASILPPRADGQVRVVLVGKVPSGQQGQLQAELVAKMAGGEAEKKK
jgi:hypothetical protein